MVDPVAPEVVVPAEVVPLVVPVTLVVEVAVPPELESSQAANNTKLTTALTTNPDFIAPKRILPLREGEPTPKTFALATCAFCTHRTASCTDRTLRRTAGRVPATHHAAVCVRHLGFAVRLHGVPRACV